MKSEECETKMQPTDSIEHRKTYRPDDDRIDAISRTEHETKEPSDLDVRRLVSNAVDTYWRDQERGITRETGDLEKETIQATAKFLDLTYDRRREFVADLLAAVLPSLVLLGSYALILEVLSIRVLTHPRRSAIELAVFFLLGGGIGIGYLMRKMKNAISKSEFAKHSLGALTAGSLMALTVLAFVSSAVKDWRESKVISLQAMAISSLQQKHQTGGFLEVAYASNHRTETVTEARAIYKIRLKEAQVDLVADIRAAGGELSLQSKDDHRILASFLVGTVESVSADTFILRTSDGTRKIKIGEQTAQPVEHTMVAVSVDPNTDTARALAPISPSGNDKVRQ